MPWRDGVCVGHYGVGGLCLEGSVVPWEGVELWDSCAGRKGSCAGAGRGAPLGRVAPPRPQCWQAAALVVPTP